MKKLTPVLRVDEIEPFLPFWTERLGFEMTVTVPEGGPVEVMFQSRAGEVVFL